MPNNCGKSPQASQLGSPDSPALLRKLGLYKIRKIDVLLGRVQVQHILETRYYENSPVVPLVDSSRTLVRMA